MRAMAGAGAIAVTIAIAINTSRLTANVAASSGDAKQQQAHQPRQECRTNQPDASAGGNEHHAFDNGRPFEPGRRGAQGQPHRKIRRAER